MTKNKYIQIRNANKIFKDKIFKARGHDFRLLLEELKNKVSPSEYNQLVKIDKVFREKYGDYEILVEVHPSKIKIVDILEDR